MEIEREVGDEGMNGFPTASTTWTALHCTGRLTGNGQAASQAFFWLEFRKEKMKERKKMCLVLSEVGLLPQGAVS